MSASVGRNWVDNRVTIARESGCFNSNLCIPEDNQAEPKNAKQPWPQKLPKLRSFQRTIMLSLRQLSTGASVRFRTTTMSRQTIGNRLFTTTRMIRDEENHDTSASETSDAGANSDNKIGQVEGVSVEKFHGLNKQVGILGAKVDMIQSDIKELGRKSDRLLYLIVGSLFLKGGWDLFRDERNWVREEKRRNIGN
ncbi:hypothetical protein HOY82DRAFT_605029 [Tuber indicum]|nr:hypothetical protein HOY82DRAFT_605029 [Tuber indicum]